MIGFHFFPFSTKLFGIMLSNRLTCSNGVRNGRQSLRSFCVVFAVAVPWIGFFWFGSSCFLQGYIIQIKHTFQSWNPEIKFHEWRTAECNELSPAALRSITCPSHALAKYSRSEIRSMWDQVHFPRKCYDILRLCPVASYHGHPVISSNLHLWLGIICEENRWKVEHVVSVQTSMVLLRSFNRLPDGLGASGWLGWLGADPWDLRVIIIWCQHVATIRGYAKPLGIWNHIYIIYIYIIYHISIYIIYL